MEEAIHDCMKTEGFDYHIVTHQPPSASLEVESTGSLYDPRTPLRNFFESRRRELSTDTDAVDEEAVELANRAYQEALEGGPHRMDGGSAGCRTKAMDLVGPAPAVGSRPVPSEQQEIQAEEKAERLRSSSDYQAYVDDIDRCIRSTGYERQFHDLTESLLAEAALASVLVENVDQLVPIEAELLDEAGEIWQSCTHSIVVFEDWYKTAAAE